MDYMRSIRESQQMIRRLNQLGKLKYSIRWIFILINFSCIPDEDVIDISKSPEPTDENQRKRNKRACISSSALSKKKKYEKTKKKTQKVC